MSADPRPRDVEEAQQPFYIAAHDSLVDEPPRTLKHGDTFALFDHYGDLASRRGNTLGLYHQDTRHLSRLKLTLERRSPLLLCSTVRTNNAVLDVDLTNPDIHQQDAIVLAKDTVHVTRTKFLWNGGCYETVMLRNFGSEPLTLRIDFDFDADFADLFEVRGFQRRSRGHIGVSTEGADAVRFVYAALDGIARITDVFFSPEPRELAPRHAMLIVELPPKEHRSVVMSVHCSSNEGWGERRVFRAMRAARRELRDATRRAAAVETSSALVNEVLCRGMADISMLVTDTEHGPYPYAGVPWFSTAFGRDGIITAMQLLWLYPALGRGVLRFLAATQATEFDAARDAEPGKILHEMRKGELANLGEVPFGRYYGSIDSTPLFVALAGQYWQQTGDLQTIEAIWPQILAALEWMDRHGDADGDGFLEYRRRRDSGLVNQGWKDSSDAVFHADGELAPAPIALCEVQGYAYLARTAAARLASQRGDTALAAQQSAQARALRDNFEASFWDDELGTYVLALDGDKRPCRVRASNAGQLLFTGIVAPDRAWRLAELFASSEFLTGWGVRTLSERERRFNPASYHNGSIWPHDNSLIARGLAQYGHSDLAARITSAIFDAAIHMDLRRLPELYCGMRRRRDKGPILYPVACTPQAWAAAAPFALLQACLGLEIDASQRLVRLRYPRLPDGMQTLEVRGLPVGDAHVDLLLRRHGDDVAVNIVRRRGEVEVVTLQR
ncbi:MAG TPA: glycogen debranching N-terminal domain-containing protein [Steroidobacteraceae bacterium]|nr:glycogen debranching N-terminal domain-containing protein [Steroidobacteraceae bacterium]